MGAGIGMVGPRFSIASLACGAGAAAHAVIIAAISPIANNFAFDFQVVFIS
jgi:hypothetical protein